MFSKPMIGAIALAMVDAKKAYFRPIPGTNPWHKDDAAISRATWVKPDWNVNYFVPNFGVDRDIITTQNNAAKAEKKLG